jgi:hypothetical protein
MRQTKPNLGRMGYLGGTSGPYSAERTQFRASRAAGGQSIVPNKANFRHRERPGARLYKQSQLAEVQEAHHRGTEIPARPSAATKKVRRLALCQASFREQSVASFETPSSPPGDLEGAMTRLIPEGKALRTRGLQAGRQAVDTSGSSGGLAPRLGIRLAGPLPFSHSGGTFRHTGSGTRDKEV